ncbi:hypothetical protein QVD17_04085 [Tagetes erecta]|uniref:Uncharacterized protein n=1 Tax=Tagetes erecta TaxID=13708 RepID=A0AAD8LCI6_TARER|nr:hypothetical protein QVD17_04085 [Tagetes erecta]
MIHGGARDCDGCCNDCISEELFSSKWSSIKKSLENEKINVGYCMLRCWFSRRCWCCLKDQKCYNHSDGCQNKCR